MHFTSKKNCEFFQGSYAHCIKCKYVLEVLIYLCGQNYSNKGMNAKNGLEIIICISEKKSHNCYNQQHHYYSCSHTLETVQDFLIKLGIKPLMHLLEISIFFTK